MGFFFFPQRGLPMKTPNLAIGFGAPMVHVLKFWGPPSRHKGVFGGVLPEITKSKYIFPQMESPGKWLGIRFLKGENIIIKKG